MKLLEYIFLFLIFPGFIFSSVVGLLVGALDRKVTARIQWRVGPPWYQNFIDTAKLFLKETTVPSGASRIMFLGMPVAALACATLLSAIVITANLRPHLSFVGDFIVVLYLSIIPSIALMLGGFSSGNPLASLGSSREMKLILSYELPFLLVSAVPIIKSNYSIRLEDMLGYQLVNGAFILSASGVLAFIVGLVSIQAKLGFTPFDLAEAETEIMGGPCIEYSGKALGIWKLAKASMTVSLPVLLLTVLFGGFGVGQEGLVRGVLAYIFILVLMILIKNTNPRVRIDQALRFFWGPMTAIAVISVGLAVMGY